MQEKRKLQEAKKEAIAASRKFRDKKVFVNKNENGYKTALKESPESVAVYRNGSEIAL